MKINIGDYFIVVNDCMKVEHNGMLFKAIDPGPGRDLAPFDVEAEAIGNTSWRSQFKFDEVIILNEKVANFIKKLKGLE